MKTENPVATVKVCDMIMSAGKTSAAINQMNEDVDSKYIFITPYLDEVKRIKDGCPDRHFKAPENFGAGKLDDLHYLLRRGENIASTHALFRKYTAETMQLIRDGGYKLILDETFNAVEIVELSSKDRQMLIDTGWITTGEDDAVHWERDGYEGRFEDVRDVIMSGHVVLYDSCLMLWVFPWEIFAAFQDVIILTFMFDAQIQKYYHDVWGVEMVYIGTRKDGNEYRFTDKPEIPEYVRTLRDKIHVLQDNKLNSIGEDQTSLSSSWYTKEMNRKGKPMITRLKNNLYNVVRHRYNAHTGEIMWTTFSKMKDKIKGRGFGNDFVSCNARATNEYRDRKYLAYCINVFYNPVLKRYFKSRGVEVKEDRYALSEMIQWIWRSAIRDGQEIWVYIPSKRMRDLLTNWLDELAELGTKKEDIA